MKVIFLDVDGVLNSVKRAKRLHYLHKLHLCSDEKWHNWDLPSRPALRALSHIVKETGAVIVLTSSWRLFPASLERLKKELSRYKLTIYDSTCNGVCLSSITGWPVKPRRVYCNESHSCKDYTDDRGAEILYWLVEHANDVESYVILDDESVDITPYFSMTFVQTDMMSGLRMKQAKRAVRILNRS